MKYLLPLVALFAFNVSADMRVGVADGECHGISPAGLEMHFVGCNSTVTRNADGSLTGSFFYAQDYIDLPFAKSVVITGKKTNALCAVGDGNGNIHYTKDWTFVPQVNDRGNGNYLTPSTTKYYATCRNAKL